VISEILRAGSKSSSSSSSMGDRAKVAEDVCKLVVVDIGGEQEDVIAAGGV